LKSNIILRVIAKLLMPFMLIFALYVQFHGDFGPGGGFQAGIIVAGAIVFYGIIFGLSEMQRLMPERVVEIMMALGVLLYALVGLGGVALGGNYLDYFVLHAEPVHGQLRGIFWVEAGVGITVAGVMIKQFYMFAGRSREAEES